MASPIHPAADLVPPMTSEEYADLKEDIGSRGLMDPIRTYQGRILDGRHRLRACEELGLPPRYQEYEGADPVGFVISLNLKRRHLTPSQRAMVAVGLANMERGGDRRSDQSAGMRFDSMSHAQAAQALHVSERYVDAAKVIERHSPDLAAQVKKGELTIMKALKTVKATHSLTSEEEYDVLIKRTSKALDRLEDLMSDLVRLGRPERADEAWLKRTLGALFAEAVKAWGVEADAGYAAGYEAGSHKYYLRGYNAGEYAHHMDRTEDNIDEHLDRLIRFCHPDRHQNDRSATILTQWLMARQRKVRALLDDALLTEPWVAEASEMKA